MPERCESFSVGQFAFDCNDGTNSHVMEGDKSNDKRIIH